MLGQREGHKLIDWHIFTEEVLCQVRHPEYIKPVLKKRDSDAEDWSEIIRRGQREIEERTRTGNGEK